jgi:hypothetical protein
MNILLRVIQILLAVWNVTGGIYVVYNYEFIRGAWASALPSPAWTAFGVLQILFALGLVLPGAAGRKLTPIAAGCLAVQSLSGCALFAKYSGFPGILWGVVPSVLAVFVVYGRMKQKSLKLQRQNT